MASEAPESEISLMRYGFKEILNEENADSQFFRPKDGDGSEDAGEVESLLEEIERMEFMYEAARERNELLVSQRDEVQRRLEGLQKEIRESAKRRRQVGEANSDEIESLDEMNEVVEMRWHLLSEVIAEKEALEPRYKAQVEEARNLQMEFSVVKSEERKLGNDALKREIDALKREMKATETRICGSRTRIRKLEVKIEGIHRDIAAGKERIELRTQLERLEKEEDQLTRLIYSGRDHEEELRVKISVLLDSYCQVSKKQNEKTKRSDINEKLAGEKSKAVSRSIELEEDMRSEWEMEETIRTIAVEEADKKRDISKLQMEVAMFGAKLSELENSNRDHTVMMVNGMQNLQRQIQEAFRGRDELETEKLEEIVLLKESFNEIAGWFENLRNELSWVSREGDSMGVQVEKDCRLGYDELKALKLKHDELVKTNQSLEMAIESKKRDVKSKEDKVGRVADFIYWKMLRPLAFSNILMVVVAPFVYSSKLGWSVEAFSILVWVCVMSFMLFAVYPRKK